MEIVHEHNLLKPLDVPKPYGIRVSLPPRDTFTRLLGTGWQQQHWYATREERDRALADMAREHLYSRRGDRPSVRFEPVEQPAAGARD
ncbi:MAG TPA: hypothetical protein VFJ95_17825 [Gammaproteobacteria bacterium]|nr:hypothetical protein [Gammaproteobacteria bacterium]